MSTQRRDLTRQRSPDSEWSPPPHPPKETDITTNINCFNYKPTSDSQAKKLQSFFPEQLDWNNQLERENGLRHFRGYELTLALSESLY